MVKTYKYNNVREAMDALRKHDESVQGFYDDPMTQSCGCTDDFQEGFDKREKQILAYVVKHASKDSAEYNEAMDRFQAYMP